MIIYRDQRFQADPRRLLRRIRSSAARLLCQPTPSHDEVSDLLIRLGTLESAVDDALFPEVDGLHPLAQVLRRGTIAAGHLLWQTWSGQSAHTVRFISQLLDLLDQASQQALPASVETRVPEGYAFYGLYPEMYLEALKEYAKACQPSRAVCLGLRSIGTSLAGVVAAALEELNWHVDSWTLRPRGHPFARVPRIAPDLRDRLRSENEAKFFIVDEGPGISGSSIGGTAAMLAGLGIPDEQVLLVPGWATDGSQLKSPVAREHWCRHRQITARFEEAWLDSGRLQSVFPGDLSDISAGSWRELLYPSRSCYPAVQPQHERRKYLLSGRNVESSAPVLLKFVGLGDVGPDRLERAQALWAAGFTTKPLHLAHGFLAAAFVPGTPWAPGQQSLDLINTIAAYLAHLAREHASPPSSDDVTLREMALVNLSEGLDQQRFRQIASGLPHSWTERPVRLDARMLPQEWIHTAAGFLKTDAIDHHDDHFLPGCQDIAWDVAGAVLEFDFDLESRRMLIGRYRALSGDRAITHRLPHYAAAYLAFRLGYCCMARELLGDTDEGFRFQALVSRYRELLCSEVNPTLREFWGG